MGFGCFPKLGVPFWGSHNKGYSVWGSMLGSPYFGKLPFLHAVQGLGFTLVAHGYLAHKKWDDLGTTRTWFLGFFGSMAEYDIPWA